MSVFRMTLVIVLSFCWFIGYGKHFYSLINSNCFYINYFYRVSFSWLLYEWWYIAFLSYIFAAKSIHLANRHRHTVQKDNLIKLIHHSIQHTSPHDLSSTKSISRLAFIAGYLLLASAEEAPKQRIKIKMSGKIGDTIFPACMSGAAE